MRTRIKFCGITSREDAAAAAAAGADAVGLVFYPPAAAAVSVADAAALVKRLPPFVEAVALFVNPAAAAVGEVIAAVKPQMLQFHGDEDAAFCCQFGLPYLKACRVQNGIDIEQTAAAHPDCRGLLLDAHVDGKPGGTGSCFDWQQIPAGCRLPLVVAGGLTAANVGNLVCTVRPWGVDVSSGIAQEGDCRLKNWDKMTAFIRSVQDADNR